MFAGKGAELNFDKHHNYKEITAYVKGLAKEYPGLVQISSIGKSFKGKDIWVLEISNRKNKKPAYKPGIYIDGGTHGDEFLGIELCLYAADYLVKKYKKDPEVTALLDSRVFYIVPVVNPDGADIFATTPFGDTRGSLRPFDDDNDGRVDEDPPEDLNGDGFITYMRQKVKEGGDWIEPEDTPGMMVRASKKAGEKGVYKLWWDEGIDNDGDGEINEDGAGGIDLNRNYPANWQPADKQAAGGAYPCSEPETRAVVEFCLAHKNIALALSNSMAGGHLVQPLLGEKASAIPPADKAVFKQIADAYKKVTGDENYKGTSLLYGTFIDWAYQHLGAYSSQVELWFMPDKYNTYKQKEEKKEKKEKKKKDGQPTDPVLKKREWLKGWYRFLKAEFQEEVHVAWKPFNHPTLGKVEIGGAKKIAYDPPGKYLPGLLERFTRAYIALARLTPLVKIKKVEIKPVQVGGGSEVEKGAALLEIEVKVTNEGPVRSLAEVMEKTSLPDRPKLSDLIILEPGANVKILSGKPRMRIGILEATGEKSDSKSAVWLVQLTGEQGKIRIISLSLKGGRCEKTIELTQQRQ